MFAFSDFFQTLLASESLSIVKRLVSVCLYVLVAKATKYNITEKCRTMAKEGMMGKWAVVQP